MALSSCVKCGAQSFEVVEGNVSGANYRTMFIQCSGCGGVAGVQEFENVSAMLRDVRERILGLESRLLKVEGTLPV
jgi:hypothetical protein